MSLKEATKKSLLGATAQRQILFRNDEQRKQNGQLFKATSSLTAGLMKKKTAVAKKDQTENKDLPSIQQSLSIEQQVMSLCHYQPPRVSPKIQASIQDLVRRRRERHNRILDQFQKKEKELLADIEAGFTNSYNTVKLYLSQNQDNLRLAFDQYTDQYLLLRGKDFLSQLAELTDLHLKDRVDRMAQFEKEQQSLKAQKDRKVDSIFKVLFNMLFDAAFILEPDIKKLIQQIKSAYFQQTGIIVAKYTNLKDELKKQNDEKVAAIRVESQAIELRWKRLQHQKLFSEASVQLLSAQFNYDDRIRSLVEQLNSKLKNGHVFHEKVTKQLFSCNVLPPQINAILNDANEYNAKLQLEYDQLFAKVIKQLGLIDQKSRNRQAKLAEGLAWAQHKSPQQLKIILEQLSGKVKILREDENKRIKQGLQWVQKYDTRGMDLVLAIGKYLSKVASKRAQQLKGFQTLNKNYQIQKARLEDEDQQRIQKLKAELETRKKQLRQSLHHMKLDENLKPCFETADNIEQAYRFFHKQNEILVNGHPEKLKSFFKTCQVELASLFELYSQADRPKILERKKKQVEQIIVKRIEYQQKKKLQELQKQNEEIKKKTGKAPPPAKPKDPKKAAQQFQERKQQLLKQSGYQKIQTFEGKQTWLVGVKIREQAKKLYQQQAKQKQQVVYNPQLKVPQVDEVEQPPLNILGKPLFEKRIMLQLNSVEHSLAQKRDAIFKDLSVFADISLETGKVKNKQFLDRSIQMLDKRIKENYPVKGQIENQIYQPRSAEIHAHKKKYQRHVRRINEAVDLQTQQFNFVLQQSMNFMKKFNEQQKSLKEQLISAKNLPALNSLQSQQKASKQSLIHKLGEYFNTLRSLQGVQIQSLLTQNNNFVNDCKLMEKGGDYAEAEVAWYRTMMGELNSVLQEQIKKRLQKITELQAYTQKRKLQTDQAFNKDYNQFIQELAARDGNGKKFAKPKRMAQERIRSEMNKCERAQQYIRQKLDQIKTLCRESSQSLESNFPVQLRSHLIGIRICIGRYARHLEALVPDCKVQQLPRLSVRQDKFEVGVTQAEAEEQKERVSKELQKMGPLSKQKEQQKFAWGVTEMENAIKAEAQKIYVGDKAKFLTGADKIPDWLRAFIGEVRKNMESFRLQSIRQLRKVCAELNSLGLVFAESLLPFVMRKVEHHKSREIQKLLTQINEVFAKSQSDKQQNLRKLRPNLKNPTCKPEFDALIAKEEQRGDTVAKAIAKLRQETEDIIFAQDQLFFKGFLNNFQFIVLYFDCSVLKEDFVKLPGDGTTEKQHMDLVDILRAKEKGVVIDNDSQRSQTAVWQGVLVNSFDFAPRLKTEYVREAAVEEVKDPKKASKKQTKDSKAAQPAATDEKMMTKEIKSYKTEKYVKTFLLRNELFEQYRRNGEQVRGQLQGRLNEEQRKEQNFIKKWQKMVSDLLKK